MLIKRTERDLTFDSKLSDLLLFRSASISVHSKPVKKQTVYLLLLVIVKKVKITLQQICY